MANFWEYESKKTQQARQAAAWMQEARKFGYEQVIAQDLKARGIPLESVVFDYNNPLIPQVKAKTKELDEIVAPVKEEKKGRGLLGGVLHGIDEVSSEVFGGKIRQPWDLLRPVQRALEAEQRYIAQPLAKALLSPLPGEYENLPKGVRWAAEALADPLTYIGPGAAFKALGVANKLPQGLKLAAPGIEELFTAPGSKRLLTTVLQQGAFGVSGVGGQLVAEELGAPGIVGSFVGSAALGAGMSRWAPNKAGIYTQTDQKVFHGTYHKYEGDVNFPSKVPQERRVYDVSNPDVIYFSPKTAVANRFAGVPDTQVLPETPDGTFSVGEQMSWHGTENARVYPGVLKKGTKVFNPDIDAFPVVDESKFAQDSYQPSLNSIHDNLKNWWEVTKNAYEQGKNPADEIAFLDHLRYTYGKSGQNEFISALKKSGYKGIVTPSEFAIWDEGVVEPLFMDRINAQPKFVKTADGTLWEQEPSVPGIPTLGIMGKDPNSKTLEELLEESLNKVQSDPQAAKATFHENARRVAAEIEAEQAAKRDSIHRQNFEKKDSATSRSRATDLSKRMDEQYNEKGEPLFGSGPSHTKSSVFELASKTATAPIDYAAVKDLSEIQADVAAKKRTFTSMARGQLDRVLSDKITTKLERLGLRLVDTEITGMVNDHRRFFALGPNYGAKVSGTARYTIDQAVKAKVMEIEEIKHLDGATATVVKDAGILAQVPAINTANPELRLMEDGVLHLTDLKENYRLFQLSPGQEQLMDLLQEPLEAHYAYERFFDIEPESDSLNGYRTHMQPTKIVQRDAQGTVIETPVGPIVAQRINGRQSFNKPRPAPSMSAGYMMGYRYLPFAESQSARVAQGFATMSNEWLNRALDGVGRSAEDLLALDPATAGLTKARNEGNRTQGRYTWLNKELTRAIHSGAKKSWIPPKWATPEVLTANPAINSIIADANIASQQGKQADRVARWQEALDRVKTLQAAQDKQIQAIRAQRKQAIDLIKTDPTRRGTFTTEFRGSYFEPQEGRQLQAVDRIDNPGNLIGSINLLNDSIRPVMATLDVSFLGVQGLIAALSSPTAYWKAMKTVFTSGYGDYEDQLMRSGKLDAMIRDGVHWAARNDFAEFIMPSIISRTPIIGGLADASNAWFTQFGNVLRSQMYQGGIGHVYKPGMSDPEQRKAREALARNVNLVSGFSPNDPGSIEKAVTFAPRFFRSQLGLIADALTKRNFSEAGAAHDLALFMGAGVSLTYAINEALGNETSFDPTDPNFLRIRVGNRDMSVFGTWDTLARALSTAATDGPVAGVEFLARVKASPVIGTVYDVMQGETLSGLTLEGDNMQDLFTSALKLGSTKLPISLQNLATEPPDPTDPTSVLGSVSQFLGTKSTPLSNSEKTIIKRDEVANAEFGRDWDNLEPHQQFDLRNRYNLDFASESEVSRAFDYRQAIGERFQRAQEQIDNTLPVGREWIEAYSDLRREQVGAYAQWAAEHEDATAVVKRSKPRTPEEKARQDYFALFDRADKEDWTPDEINAAIGEFEASLTSSQQAYIDRNTGLRDTARVKEYKRDQDKLSAYWGLADQVWERLAPRLPDGESSPSVQDYTNNLIAKLQAAGVPDRTIVRRIQTNPVLREVDRATQELRQRLRRREPGIDALLVKWYGYTPTR